MKWFSNKKLLLARVIDYTGIPLDKRLGSGKTDLHGEHAGFTKIKLEFLQG
jgi:hypothetical protein